MARRKGHTFTRRPEGQAFPLVWQLGSVGKGAQRPDPTETRHGRLVRQKFEGGSSTAVPVPPGTPQKEFEPLRCGAGCRELECAFVEQEFYRQWFARFVLCIARCAMACKQLSVAALKPRYEGVVAFGGPCILVVLMCAMLNSCRSGLSDKRLNRISEHTPAVSFHRGGQHLWCQELTLGEFSHGVGEALWVTQSDSVRSTGKFRGRWHSSRGRVHFGVMRRECMSGDPTLDQVEFSEYMDVRWGERMYLVPSDDLAEFAHSITVGLEPRSSEFGRWFFGLRALGVRGFNTGIACDGRGAPPATHCAVDCCKLR